MGVAALRIVLRTRRDLIQFDERFGQKFRTGQGQTVKKFACGLLLTDLGLVSQQHIAGVQTFRHLHGGNACHFVARDDRPLNRSGAAPARQQRAVHVDAAVRRNVEHCLRQQLAVRHNNNDFRCQLAQTRLLVLIFEGIRLKNRDIMLQCERFHRRCGENLLASLRLIRLGVHGADVMSGVDERLQARHGEVRRAHEYDAHYSSPPCIASGSMYSSTFSVNRWPSRCSVSWQKHCATMPSPSRSNQLPLRSCARIFAQVGRVT